MAVHPRSDPGTPLGQLALYEELGMAGAPPFVQSRLVAGARRTRETEGHQEERYPAEYRTDGSLLGHLRFALRREPLDLRVVAAALTAIGEEALIAWCREEPTGAHSRRAWFLYETLTGRTLDIPRPDRQLCGPARPTAPLRGPGRQLPAPPRPGQPAEHPRPLPDGAAHGPARGDDRRPLG